jgi:sigma-B regulation protein RsbU (phosphoserine phosphatase)
LLLRTRIVLIFGIATLLLLAAVAVPLWIVQSLSDTALSTARQEAQDGDWRAALANAATPYEILSEQLRADPALQAAVAHEDIAAARTLLAAAQARAGVSRIDILAQEGRLFASSAGLAADGPMIDSTNLRNRVQQNPWLQGVEVGPAGNLLVVVTSAFHDGHFVSVAAPAEPVLQALAAGGERSLFLVDRKGALMLSTAPGDWAAVAAARAGAGGRIVPIERNGHIFDAVATAVLNTAGVRIGTLISVGDVTAAAQRRTLVLLATGSAAVLVFAALLLALYGFAKGALDPLSEITQVIRAMAAGDAMVSADIPDRHDEVGAIAAAVEVFRRDIVALARTKLRETLRLAQQQALIRREMEALAGILEDSERDDFRAALQSAGGDTALAKGFERMASQVVAQHRKLANLLEERTRDLQVVRDALAERAHLTRLRQELEVARHLQLSSLPQVFPPFPDRTDFEVYAAMAPAKEVGGDFYDFALIGGDRLAIMIGDASGKGVSAAMFIAMARSILRSATVRGASPSQALGLANSTLAVENHTMMFATVFIAVLDLRTGWLTYASAGHNPPYLVIPGGRVLPLEGRSGIALGIIDDADYEDEEVQVPEGGSIVLFTDGVTEAHDPSLSMFGEERLEAGLAHLAAAGPEVTVVAIQQQVQKFADGTEQADDITVLSARYLGPAQAAGPTVARADKWLPARPEV